MGWRVHPIHKTRKHHNGTDIVSLISGPTYIESFADAKVLKATVSNAAGGGFGTYVVLLHKIDGEFYTSLYAHLEPGSLQVKPGQKIKTGTVLGKMGTSGMSTGKHLHWEIWKGKVHGWSSDGKGFVEPIGFVKALTAAEVQKAFAKVGTPEPEIVELDHCVEPVKKAAPKPAVKTKAPAKPKQKTHKVVSGDTLGKIATRYKTTAAALSRLNKITNVNSIKVGQVIKLS